MNSSPIFSVIIPVRNDAQELSHSLKQVKARAGHHPVEIIVVDGQSRDNSVEVARKEAHQVLVAKQPGRSTQMHEGALAAQGRVLVFLHSDTQLPPHWDQILYDVWHQSAKPVATAFNLGFDDHGTYYELMCRMAYWRTRYVTGVPHGDQAVAVEREVYLKVGGYPAVPLMEEYYLMRKLKPLGSLQILPQKVVTSSRRYRRNNPVINNLRNLLIIGLFYLGVSPHFLAKLYK